MSATRPFALYDSFSTGNFGGATAGIVSNAADMDADTMQTIAREVGAPATGFVRSVEPSCVDVRFYSTVTELGMCGHGTVALGTHLVESGVLEWHNQAELETTLITGDGPSPLRVRNHNGSPLVLLSLSPSRITPIDIDRTELARVLGISQDCFHLELPIEVATGAFTHLVVPLRDLAAIRSLELDFGAIARFSRANNVQTVTVFTLEVEHQHSTVHCRDFCPAVGTPESSGAGTTNAALASYLAHHQRLETRDGALLICSEQGYECGRPSEVRVELELADGAITALSVGGQARKSIVGEIFLPSE